MLLLFSFFFLSFVTNDMTIEQVYLLEQFRTENWNSWEVTYGCCIRFCCWLLFFEILSSFRADKLGFTILYSYPL